VAISLGAHSIKACPHLLHILGKMMIKISNLLRALVAVGVGAIATFGAHASTSSTPNTLIPNQYIVVLKPTYCAQLTTRSPAAQRASRGGMDAEQLDVSTPDCDLATSAQLLMQRYGGQVGQVYGKALNGFMAYLPDANAAALRADVSVQYADQNQIMKRRFTSGLQGSTPTWGLDRLDSRQAPERLLDGNHRFSGTGKGVLIYSVDNGIRTAYAELNGRVVKGVLSRRGVDENGNTDACDLHGTAVMATAAGQLFGLAKEATIVPVKVDHCDDASFFGGISLSDVIGGLNWIATKGQKPAVVNMSNGFDTIVAQSLDTSVTNLINSGFVVVIAAGNANKDACKGSPARVPSAITVGASDSKDGIWKENADEGSSWGGCVTVFAPGADIDVPKLLSNHLTEKHSGTSLSAPYVSGLAAILLERNPTATPAQIKQQIIDASIPNIVGGLETRPNTPNRLASASNLWPLSVAVLSMTSRIDTTRLSLSWRPYVTIRLQNTIARQLPWNGAITIRGRWDTGDDFSCVVKAYTNSSGQFSDAVCDHKGPLMAKANRRSARIDILSLEGANITYDQGQNVIASLFIRQN
jgi:Subtilase family